MENEGETKMLILLPKMAGATGLEPAASGVTGRRSNQLSYAPVLGIDADLNLSPRQVKHRPCFPVAPYSQKCS
jgi:hypothetical protein